MNYFFVLLISTNYAFAMGDPTFLPPNPPADSESFPDVSVAIKEWSHNKKLQAQEDNKLKEEQEIKINKKNDQHIKGRL